jgi:hypothetical protein
MSPDGFFRKSSFFRVFLIPLLTKRPKKRVKKIDGKIKIKIKIK